MQSDYFLIMLIYVTYIINNAVDLFEKRFLGGFFQNCYMSIDATYASSVWLFRLAQDCLRISSLELASLKYEVVEQSQRLHCSNQLAFLTWREEWRAGLLTRYQVVVDSD